MPIELDSAERLLTAVSASQADEVHKVKMELRRTIFDEQVRAIGAGAPARPSKAPRLYPETLA